MIKTEFYTDFLEYYRKAHILQVRNKGESPDDVRTGDPIMDNVTIYDTVNRKFAGFSKALEDIHGVRCRKDLVKYDDYSRKFDSKIFHFLHLFHRFTGSGASFQPTFLPDGSRNPREHGYHNNKVEHLCAIGILNPGREIEKMREYIVQNTSPMVTSTGNQPPSLKNPDPKKYRLAQQYYFDQVAESFVTDYLTFIMNYEYEKGHRATIKDGVDFSCEWHKLRGFKQWHFVLTAFVMDTAEYYPELVDPNSHCYYGANAIRSLDLMFIKEKTDSKKKGQWYEDCMTEIVTATGGRPYDIEDVLCDYVRYLVEYKPKGYEKLEPELGLNRSTLKKMIPSIGLDYPPEVVARMNQIIG